jgi:antirestriction protein ArdC
MSRKEQNPRADVYARITDRIVTELERGVRPWVKPWNAANAAGRITRPLRHNGMPYQGINVVLLWSEAVGRGFTSPIWMTFKQSLELGGHVRKGESGTLVVYANKITKTGTDEHGDEVERAIPFLRAYTVFCVDQIENLPDHYYGRPAPSIAPAQRLAQVDAFFANTVSNLAHEAGVSRATANRAVDLLVEFRAAEVRHRRSSPQALKDRVRSLEAELGPCAVPRWPNCARSPARSRSTSRC